MGKACVEELLLLEPKQAGRVAPVVLQLAHSTYTAVHVKPCLGCEFKPHLEHEFYLMVQWT